MTKKNITKIKVKIYKKSFLEHMRNDFFYIKSKTKLMVPNTRIELVADAYHASVLPLN